MTANSTYIHAFMLNDYRIPLATIIKRNGVAVDLTGFTVKFGMVDENGTEVIAETNATITSAAAGAVQYAWATGDVDTAGLYFAWFILIDGDGKRESFPFDGTKLVVRIIPKPSGTAGIVTLREILTVLGMLESATSADLDLLNTIRPLAESSLLNWFGQKIQKASRVEFYPAGQSIDADRDDIAAFQKVGNVFVYAGHQYRGTNVLQLRHTPVHLAGLEVREDLGAFAGQASGSFGADTALTLGTDYFLDVDDSTNSLSRTGILYRIGAWPTDPRSVKVTYQGGWDATQLGNEYAGDLKLAALETVINEFKKFKANQGTAAGVLQSESLGGDYSYTLSQHSIANASMLVDIPLSAKQRLFHHKAIRYM